MNPSKRKKIYRSNILKEKELKIENKVEEVKEEVINVINDVINTQDNTAEEVVKVERKKKAT